MNIMFTESEQQIQTLLAGHLGMHERKGALNREPNKARGPNFSGVISGFGLGGFDHDFRKCSHSRTRCALWVERIRLARQRCGGIAADSLEVTLLACGYFPSR